MVFEALIADLINRFIGEYVENLDRSQLNVGIWGGDISLTNLDVKEGALNELDLPFSVVYGHLGRLTIKVPWKNLYTAPVIAIIEDLNVIVVPNTCIQYDEEKDERQKFEVKQKELARIEEAKLKEATKKEEKPQDSFTEKLAIQIVKNLQIEIRNIHIRYEDNFSNPKSPISFGLTLHNLSFQTTDSHWIPCIIQQNVTLIHKLVTLDSFTIYWSDTSNHLCTMPSHIREDELSKGIATSKYLPSNVNYMLGPVNAKVQLIMNSKPESTLPAFFHPKILLSMSIDDMVLSLTNKQYQDVLNVLGALDFITIANMYKKYRPPIGVKGHAKLWWKFAINCILEEEVKRKSRNWSWQHMKEHRNMVKNYKEAYKNKLLAKKSSQSYLATLEEYERKLDVFNITVARRQAEIELASVMKKDTWGTWIGGWFSKAPATAENMIAKQFQEVMNPSEKAKLYEAIGYQESDAQSDYPPNYVAYDLTFVLNKFIVVLKKVERHREHVISEISLKYFGATLRQRPSSKNLKIKLSVDSFNVTGHATDGYSPPEIVSSHNVDNTHPIMSIEYEANPLHKKCDQVVSITTQSLKAIYDYKTTEKLIQIFQSPDSISLDQLYEAAMMKFQDIKEMSALGIKHAIEQHKVLDLSININPSYVIVPQNGVLTNKCHKLIVNLGKFSLTSYHPSNEDASVSFESKNIEQVINLAYDKFILEVSQVGLYLTNSDDISDKSTEGSIQHLLQPLSFSVILEKSIIMDDYRIPQLKISGELPLVKLSFSDINILETIDLVLSLPLPQPNLSTKESLVPITQSGLVAAKSSHHALKVVQHSGTLAIDTPKPKGMTEQAEDEIDSIHKQIVKMEMAFIIKQITLDLYSDKHQSQHSIIKMAIDNFGANAKMRMFDITFECYLGGISLIDNEYKTSDGDFVRLISSPLMEQNQNLIAISYIGLTKKTDLLKSLYDDTIQHVTCHISDIHLQLHLEAILSLLRLLNTVQLTVEAKMRNTIVLPATPAHSSTSFKPKSNFSFAQPAKKKFYSNRLHTEIIDQKIEAFLSSIKFSLITEKNHIGDIALEGVEARGIIQRSQTELQLSLKNISCFNPNPKTKYNQILTKLGGELLQLNVMIFNDFNEEGLQNFVDPNLLDIAVRLVLGQTKFVYLSNYLSQMMQFVDHFQTAKQKIAEASAAAAEAAKMGMEIAFVKSSKIGLDISLQAPLILIPQNTSSTNALVIDLGTLKLRNSFVRSPQKNQLGIPAMFENMVLELNHIMLDNCQMDSSNYQTISMQRRIIEPISFELHVERNLSTSWLKDHPELTVSGHLHAINISFGADDWATIMKVLAENIGQESQGSTAVSKHTSSKKVKKGKHLEVTVFKDEKPLFEKVYERINLKFMMDTISLSLYKASEMNAESRERSPNLQLSKIALLSVLVNAFMKTDNSFTASVKFGDLILDDTRISRKQGIKRFMYRTPSTDQSEDKVMMCITFEKTAANDMTLSVDISSFSVIINLNYFFTISKIFTKALPQKEVKPVVETEKAGPTSIPSAFSTFTINLNIQKPDIVLIEDLENLDSNALILNAICKLRILMTPSDQNISAEVDQFQLFTCCYNPDKRAQTTRKILNPVAVIVQGAISNGISQRFDLSLTDINIHVNPKTVTFLSSIASTLQIKESASVIDHIPPNYCDIWDMKPLSLFDFWFLRMNGMLTNEATDSETSSQGSSTGATTPSECCVKEEAIIRMSTIIITLESGMGEHTMPLLLMEMSLQMQLSNWSSKMLLLGNFDLEVAYYNEDIAIWEPLVEPNEENNHLESWKLNFEVSKSNVTLNSGTILFNKPAMCLNLSSDKTLLLSFTKTSMEVLKMLIEEFQNAMELNEVKQIQTPEAPYLIKNQLGTTLICNLNNDFKVMSKDGLRQVDTLLLDEGTSIHLSPKLVNLNIRSVLRKQEVFENLRINIQIPMSQATCVRSISLSRTGLRYYQLQHRSYPGDQWGFVVDISSFSGSKVVTFRSPVEIKNNFTVPFDVFYMDSVTNEILTCGIVDSNTVFTVPLHAVYTNSQELFFRPSFEDSSYKICTDPVYWKRLNTDSTQNDLLDLSCPHSLKPSLGFYIKASRELEQIYFEETNKKTLLSSKFTIQISPTVVIRNLLPFPIYLKLKDSSFEAQLEEGDSKELWHAKLGESQLEIILRNYLEKDWFSIVDLKHPEENLNVCSFVSPPKILDLGIFSQVRNNTLELSLYCPFWMVNQTGKHLTYKSSGETQTFYHPPDLDVPLLFSFKSKFFTSKKKAALKVDGSEWSDNFTLDMIGSSGTVVVKNKDGGSFYVTVNVKMGNVTLNRLVTFSPYYLLINNSALHTIKCKENDINGQWFEVPPKDCVPFWPLNPDKNELAIACYSDEEHSLTLPFSFKKQHHTLLKLNSQKGGLNVECIVAETSSTLKFDDYQLGYASVLIINNTAATPCILGQVGENVSYQLIPKNVQLYVWDNPTGNRKLKWQLGEESNTTTLQMDGIGEIPTKKNPIYWVSFLDGMQRILLFTEDLAEATAAQESGGLEPVEFEIITSLNGLGISLVNNLARLDLLYFGITSSKIVWEASKLDHNVFKPMSIHENLIIEKTFQNYLLKIHLGDEISPVYSLENHMEVDFANSMILKPSKKNLRRNYLPGFWIKMKKSEHHIQFHAKLNSLQIDNQLLDGVFPIMLAPVQPPKTVAASQGPKPFGEVSIMIRRAERSNVYQFKYFKVLIQEFHIKLSMGTINALSSFFYGEEDFNKINYPVLLEKDIEYSKRNLKTLVEMYLSVQTKNFYDQLHFSPLKVHLSFSMLDAGDSSQSSIQSHFFQLLLQSIGVTLTDIQDVTLKLDYFEKMHTFMSNPQLIEETKAHYSSQTMRQVFVLVLGLDVIGNPVGLVMGLKTGVGDLFYEPFQGAIQGPEEFAEGLALGVRSLFGHAVGGAAGAFSRITGTLGKGFAALTMDKNYQKRRLETMNKGSADISHNLAQSGKGLVMGVVEGFTGIVTKPIEGAQEEGVEGFFKGVGKGLLGVIARPTSGAIDFASSSLDAVKRVTDLTDEVRRVRPPRFIRPDKIIRPYIYNEAFGNQILHDVDKGRFIKTDYYITHGQSAANKSFVFVTNYRVLYITKSDVFGNWMSEWNYTYNELEGYPSVVQSKTLKLLLKENKKRHTFFSGKENGKMVNFTSAMSCQMVCEKIIDTMKLANL